MKTYISLLRGINVSGQKKILMKDLKQLYQSLKLTNVITYVQSGNVIFKSKETNKNKLAVLIENQIKKIYGYTVSVFILDVGTFQRIINNNLFLNKRTEEPARLYVTFLKLSPSHENIKNLRSIELAGKDEFSLGENEIYLFCPDGYGTTKLSNNFFEKKLGVPATTRNWNTVNALYRLAIEK